ncbi:vacuolar protein sorting protein VPS34, partial [Acrasis kona]
ALLRFEKLSRTYNSNQPVNQWLDRFTSKRTKELQKEKENEKKRDLFLNIELPLFDHTIFNSHILKSVQSNQPSDNDLAACPSTTSSVDTPSTKEPNITASAESPLPNSPTLKIPTLGPEVRSEPNKESNRSSAYYSTGKEFRTEFRSTENSMFEDEEASGRKDISSEDKFKNLAEEKHLILTKKSMDQDPTNVKPNALETRKIQAIVDYAPLKDLVIHDKEIIWRFRYYLTTNKKALVKFLRCVDWRNTQESQEAEKLIRMWNEIGTVDALFLLSKYFRNNTIVRQYAVSILEKSDDENLHDVLLQLVQAIRYEIPTDDNDHITLEGADQVNTITLKVIESDLVAFLFRRAGHNFLIANHLYWYLRVEMLNDEKGSIQQIFGAIHQEFKSYLKNNNNNDPTNESFHDRLCNQQLLVDNLNQLSKSLKVDKDSRPKKIKKLQKIFAADKWQELTCSLPVSPSTLLKSVVSEEAHIFKSAMSPILVPFKSTREEKVLVIFKSGDDLRQDQLVIQLFQLMDKLLKKNGLDMKLTPYQVLSCGMEHGFVECVVPNSPLSSIIAKSDIKAWLKQNNNNDEEEYRNSILNFVKSCAGYCVVTYILGIGDRHLDNILLKPNGKLFHIDFGFMLGKDPKPFAPPMKLCKEMVEGMDGSRGELYTKFKELCCTCYNILRKNAHLILNLLILMVDASIKDIDDDGDLDAPMRNLVKVQEKFRLDLNDTQAMLFMQNIINDSEKALFPQITETIHRWAQYWRS